MKNLITAKLLILITTVLGLLFVITTQPKTLEGFDDKCENLLIEKEGKFHLLNTTAAKVPGINPIIFNNLEEYVKYFESQSAKNIHCPVLFLQHTYDIQGDEKYIKRPSPLELQGGQPTLKDSRKPTDSSESKLLDAYHDHLPYNKNMYPGFDPENQYIGLETPLDKMYNQDFNGVSPNPMDPNWAGSELTQTLVDNGYYDANNVYKIKKD